MAFAQGSRSRLSFLEESTFGTTPAGNFQEIPYITQSLQLTKERVEGNDIQSDRMPRVDRHGNRNVAGAINVDLRDGSYDDFIGGAMFNTWSSNVLTVGTDPRYFSIEDYAEDVDYARLFTGCSVTSMEVSVSPNEPVSTVLNFVGKDMTISQSQKSINSATNTQPFDAYSGDIRLGDVGSLSNLAIVTSLNFTIENSLSPTFVIGSDTTPHLEFGRAVVTGSFSVYFEDDSIINRFLNETESALEFSLNDPTGANEYTFLFPFIKINSADTAVENPQSRIVNCEFVSLYDTTEGTNLKITRPA